MSDERDASSSFVWPPTIYVSAFVLALALSWLAPLPIVAPGMLRWALLLIGAVLFADGMALALWAEVGFKRARTAVLPTRATTAIVTGGPYRFTRNPMYLGMSLGLAGCAGAFNSWWFLIALPIAMLAVTKLAIEPEEAYLERKFGAAYVAYKTSVRRWI